MKLGFDIDGIVADMAKAMVEHMNKEFNLNHTPEVFKKHKIFDNEYVDDSEENEKVADSIFKGVIENPEAIITIEPHEDAKEAIKKLVRAGHSIHFITARAQFLRESTTEWFRINKIPFDSIHVVGKNGRRGNLVSKGQTARILNLDFFIDDFIDHLGDMYKYKNRWRKGVGLFTRPWNINEPFDASRFIRFNEWNEVIRHLGIHKR